MEREYIVTVRKDVDWRELHAEIIRDTTTDDSVDSNIVPDRACECADERSINNRNTHYNLTDDEANKLRQDPRILAVEAVDDIPEPTPTAFQEGEFNRNSTASGQHDNWGMLRHTSTSNTYGSSTTDPGGTYDYVLDGTGVDMVIVDTGIQADHPEWEDADGISRLQQINWFTESGVSGTQPANFYTDVDGHGTHCIGTMAGKYFGWAKNARIYNITLYGNTGNNISWSQMVDVLIGWHNNKPNDPATGVKRPTVVNMSFQYSVYLDTSVTPNQIVGLGDITGGNHRGVSHTETVRSNLTQYGVVGTSRPDIGTGYYMFGRKYASIDADVEQLINNGIHVCTAAGNNYQKIDTPSGVDYNNYVTAGSSYVYYHRGKSPSIFEGGNTLESSLSSPSADINEGFDVGALDNTSVLSGSTYLDRKTSFSDSGPAVEIYTVGRYVISAQPTSASTSYYWDSNFKQAKYSGTSMAAPQMCGMIGLLAQAHPDWTPAQIKKYFISNSQALMYDTGNTNDYTTTNTIHGGNNRVAYFPMNGQKPFGYST